MIGFLVIVFPMLIAYLAVGVRVARGEYTELVRGYNMNREAQTAILLEQKRAEFKNVTHVSYCNMSYRLLGERGCDCRSRDTWWGLKRKVAELEKGILPAPTVPAWTITTWPATLVSGYIKGGASKIPDYAEIERLEQETKQLL